MKQTDPQFKLRLPGELKVKLETAAERSGMTMTGEILNRLQASFESNGDGEQWLQSLAAAATMKAEMLSMRASVVTMRMESLVARAEAISREVELLAHTAKTDEDFEEVAAKSEELGRLLSAVPALQRERDEILRERGQQLRSIQGVSEMLRAKQRALEQEMEAYLAKQTPEKRKALEGLIASPTSAASDHVDVNPMMKNIESLAGKFASIGQLRPPGAPPDPRPAPRKRPPKPK